MMSTRPKNNYLCIIILLILWLAAEIPWLSSVPINILNESVLHQNEAVELYKTLHSLGLPAFLFKAASLDIPTSPLSAFITALALNVRFDGPWAWFFVQFFYNVLLIIAIERLGTLLYDERTGLYSALTAMSLLIVEGYLRSSYVDFSMAAILTWNYWAFLKSERFTRPLYSWLFTALTVIGMLAKWSYLPLHMSFFLLFLFLRSLKERTLDAAACKQAALHISTGAVTAYLLYYRTGLKEIINNYRSCICFKPSWEHLTHLS